LERVAVIGINSLDGSLQKRLYRFSPGDALAKEVATVVTSGSLVSLQIAASLGPFREELFIDFVDDEYCLRARSKGFKILLIPEPLAVHALGSPKFRRLPWRTIGTSNHAALRRYYMTRNHVVLVKEYAFREPGWVLRSLYARMKSFLLLLLFDDDRLLKMRFMWRGLIDGIAGRMGELPRH
jgi:rhamnosyltransferase